MNIFFCAAAEKKMFMSMFYGIFDLDEGQLHFARAGHDPALFKRQGQDAQWLESRGMAAGLNGGVIFEKTLDSKSLELQPGDMFVIYTDGLSEAINRQGDAYSPERLAQAVNRFEGQTAQELMDHIRLDFRTHLGKVLPFDDATCVIIALTDQ